MHIHLQYGFRECLDSRIWERLLHSRQRQTSWRYTYLSPKHKPYIHTHKTRALGRSHSYTHTLTHSLTHSLTYSLSHSRTQLQYLYGLLPEAKPAGEEGSEFLAKLKENGFKQFTFMDYMFILRVIST